MGCGLIFGFLGLKMTGIGTPTRSRSFLFFGLGGIELKLLFQFCSPTFGLFFCKWAAKELDEENESTNQDRDSEI